MKIEKNCFNLKNVMDFNHVVINSGAKEIKIHNSNGDGIGKICRYKIDGVIEDMEFTLSKRDFQTIAKINDFDLKIKGNKIIVTSKKAKFTLANSEIYINEPQIDKMETLNITSSDILEFERFVGDDNVSIQTKGVTVANNYIIATDRVIVMIKYTDTGLTGDAINIPKECFPLLSDDSILSTDGKMAIFTSGNDMVYTNLINVKMADVTNEKLKIPKVTMKVDANDIIDAINMIKSYANVIKLKMEEDVLHVINVPKYGEESYELDVKVDTVKFDGNSLCMCLSADKLKKVLYKLRADETIGFMDSGIVVNDAKENTYKISLCQISNDKEVA